MGVSPGILRHSGTVPSADAEGMQGVESGRFARRIAMLLLATMTLVGMVTPVVSASPAAATGGHGGDAEQAAPSTTTLSTPLLVVTVRAQGSNRFGILYWQRATPNVAFDVFRSGTRIARVSGSTTGNNLYTDAVKGLRGSFTYRVCYAGTSTCSNSITVAYSASTETIRYAPTCPTTGTATCVVTLS